MSYANDLPGSTLKRHGVKKTKESFDQLVAEIGHLKDARKTAKYILEARDGIALSGMDGAEEVSEAFFRQAKEIAGVLEGYNSNSREGTLDSFKNYLVNLLGKEKGKLAMVEAGNAAALLSFSSRSGYTGYGTEFYLNEIEKKFGDKLISQINSMSGELILD